MISAEQQLETTNSALCAHESLHEGAASNRPVRRSAISVHVTLLTGGSDRPYALGMASALVNRGIAVDFIGSDELDAPELREAPLVRFFNLRGDQSENAPFHRKFVRIVTYYARLLEYVLRSRPKVFHILWNNKFEHFDRTLLMLYYRLLGKRIVFTAHNVNMRKRDGRDSWLNRLSLGIQYRLCHQIFVHTAAMKGELVTDFAIPPSRVTVIPFGINNTCPSTPLDRQQARERVGMDPSEKVLLFFGQIAPYKGLEYLISAFSDLGKDDAGYRLLIAGKIKKGHAAYWSEIQSRIHESGIRGQMVTRLEHIPDEEVELYFTFSKVAFRSWHTVLGCR
jgi:D-inositol-3-phosphate glycosyltransferase